MAVIPNRHNRNLAIRVFSREDKDLIFKWRNSNFLVSHGSSQRTVSREEHSAWFDKVINSKNSYAFILLKDDEPIGQLRFDQISSGKYMVAIYLIESCVGRGYGSWFLDEGLGRVKSLEREAQFEAIVHEKNDLSLNLFNKLGFIPKESKRREVINGIRYIRLVFPQFKFDSLIKFYENNLRNYENTVGSLGWGSEASQIKRFEILSKIGDIRGSRILDVGCGLGDFGYWLSMQGYECAYEGIDISANMIRQAKIKYPDLHFEVMDVLSQINLQGEYSYVFASGIFNRKINNHEKFIFSMIKKMYQISKKGVAFNILSIRAPYKEPEEYYADPIKLNSFCKTITNRVVLNHDYMDHDFTIYMYK